MCYRIRRGVFNMPCFWAVLILLQCSVLFAYPPESLSELQAAFAAARDRNYIQAIQHLKREIQQDSSSVAPLFLIAEYAQYANSLDDELNYFKRATERRPRTASLYFTLALLQRHTSNWKGVFENSRRALEAGCTAPEALELLVSAALEVKRTDELARVLQKLRKRKEQKPLYQLGYARWRIQIKNYKRAQKTLDDYLKENPGDWYGPELAGDLALKRGSQATSTKHYRAALDLGVSAGRQFKMRLWTKLASNYFTQDKPDSAELCLSLGDTLATEIGSLQNMLKIVNLRRQHYRRLGAFQKLAEASMRGLDVASSWPAGTGLVSELYYDAGWANEQMRDFLTARTLYEMAAINVPSDGKSDLLPRVNFAFGRIFVWQAEPDSALKYLREGLAQAEKGGRPDLSYAIRLQTADILRDEGMRDEARDEYQKVLRYGQRTQQHDITEICFVKLAKLYLREPAQFRSAEYYLAMADALARQTVQLRYAANHRWMQGDIALLQDDVETAERYYRHAVQLGMETGSYLSILAGQAGLVRTYLKAGFSTNASSHADSAMVHLADYCTFGLGEYTSEFFDIKADLFTPALAAYSATGDLNKIYSVCEQYKALQHTLATSAVRHRLAGTKTDSVRMEMDRMKGGIREKWTELWGTSQEDRRDGPQRIAQVEKKIDELHRRQQDFLDSLARTNPALSEVFAPYTLGVDKLQQELTILQSTFIHYFVAEDATFIVIVKPDAVYCKRVNVNKTHLKDLVRNVSAMFAEVGNGFVEASDLPAQFHLGYVSELYKFLFEPIRGLLAPESTLIISGDSFLNRLPFEILVANPEDLIDDYDYQNAHFLVEDYTLAYLPFAGFLEFKRADKTAPTKYLAVFYGEESHLTNNGADRTEQRNDVAALKDMTDALGEDGSYINLELSADKHSFFETAPDYQVLQLAEPGQLRDGAPLYSAISFAGKNDRNAWLKAYELFGTRLSADVAVLSNCDPGPSMRNQLNGTDGFLAGFNYAGVQMLVASRWRVHQEKATPILTEFYRNLQDGKNAAAALRQAKLTYLNKGEGRNPYFWAGFVLYGSCQPVKFKLNSVNAVVAFAIVAIAVLVFLVARQIVGLVNARRQPQSNRP